MNSIKKLLLTITLTAPVLLLAACSNDHSPQLSAKATVLAYNDAANTGDTNKLFSLCSPEYEAAIRPDIGEYIKSTQATPTRMTILGEEKRSDTESIVAFTAVAFDKATNHQVDSSSVGCRLVLQSGQWKITNFRSQIQVK